MTAEEQRLLASRQRKAHWKRWGPYLSERAWGTVREDYSADGSAWSYFPHDQARSKAYRWNEDGLAGICDRHQKICFAIALWNGKDPILKERAFGLANGEGNHGEDVKEAYFYLDSTPTHSYMKYLYKYPQAAFPYEQLLRENGRRDKQTPEFELADTGIFDDNRYFDVLVEYAKGDVEDLLIRVSVSNRGPETASLHLLPTLWFRNVWSWNGTAAKPTVRADQPLVAGPHPTSALRIDEPTYGRRWLYHEGHPEVLFCENETNNERLHGTENTSPSAKDGINDFVIHGDTKTINAESSGTKAAIHYPLQIAAGATVTVKLRLTDAEGTSAAGSPLGSDFDRIFQDRQREADEFYATVIPPTLSDDGRRVMRQAFALLLWNKQYYHYVVDHWLNGDPGQPPPPPQRRGGRNSQWGHLYNDDILVMPDKWEYPYYCVWDTAFQCIPLCLIDADLAKEQLILLLREWYMHPNGQIPAYEWAFNDVNPPVESWAAWRVYQIDAKRAGRPDRVFLERVFHKLLLNFNWWINRKDSDGRNIFQGGFLGMDNIGVFDRSAPLPNGGHIDQSDGTSWMAMYCLNLLSMAKELARENPAYEDVASKFWEHFLSISHAVANRGGRPGMSLWTEEDGFFYDVLNTSDGQHIPLRVRSMVGLFPLFAVETVEADILDKLKHFKRRVEWFIAHRPDLTCNVACMRTPGHGERRLLSLVNQEQLRRVLARVLDENEFLSPWGLRTVSRYHHDHPYTLACNGAVHEVRYDPGDSTSGMFGGNSNWRGPVWTQVNYLFIESLQKYQYYYGDSFRVECPTGSGRMMTLGEVAVELSRRVASAFLHKGDGRPSHGGHAKFRDDPHWRDLVLFHEYFNGDTGAGIGASHQGWTTLVAKLLQQNGE